MKKILYTLGFLIVSLAANAQFDTIRARDVIVNGSSVKTDADSLTTAQKVEVLNVLLPSTDFSNTKEDRLLNEAFGTNYIGGTLWYMPSTQNSSLSDGTIRWILCDIKTDTAIGVEVANPTGSVGSFTADNYNGIGLYSYSNGTATKIATTANDENIWKVAIAEKDTFLFTNNVYVTEGVYYLALLYNSSAETTAPALMIQYVSQGDANFNNTDYFNCYSSGTELPATFDISTATKSNTAYQVRIIGKGHLE